jgi:hypothetical protein
VTWKDLHASSRLSFKIVHKHIPGEDAERNVRLGEIADIPFEDLPKHV